MERPDPTLDCTEDVYVVHSTVKLAGFWIREIFDAESFVLLGRNSPMAQRDELADTFI